MRVLLRLATCALLMGNVIVLQGQRRQHVEKIGYLCGKLVHLDSRAHGEYGAILDHTSPLPNVVIKLYPSDNKRCCADLKVLEQATTGTGGEFTFAENKTGAYWLVTIVANREFKLALLLVPPTANTTACRNQEFEIEDSGKFRILRMVGYL